MGICRKAIEYAGADNPATPEEIRIEILGLRNAIRQAEELISRHEQAMEIAAYLGRLALEGQQHDTEGTGSQTPGKAEENQGCPPLVR